MIDDRSYVSMYETKTEMQTSMATSSFSETDVAAAGFAANFLYLQLGRYLFLRLQERLLLWGFW